MKIKMFKWWILARYSTVVIFYSVYEDGKPVFPLILTEKGDCE